MKAVAESHLIQLQQAITAMRGDSRDDETARAYALALTKLEECEMWLNKAMKLRDNNG